MAPWHAEGVISFASFITHLMRTDQDFLDEPGFPFPADGFVALTLRSMAAQSAAGGGDTQLTLELPRGLSAPTRARVFHERVHYAQLLSYPLLQLRFLYQLEELRVAVRRRGGQAATVCGLGRPEVVGDADEVAWAKSAVDALVAGDLHPGATVATGAGVGIVEAGLSAGGGHSLPGYAGVVEHDGAEHLVPFDATHLMESTAQVAQHLFEGTGLPRLTDPRDPRDVRYHGCWEVWHRLHADRFADPADLAAAFLTAADLALSAHVLAERDEGLADHVRQGRSRELRLPHLRFGQLAVAALTIDPDPADLRRRLSDRLGWPDPDRAHRFMAAFLTQRILWSSLWRVGQLAEIPDPVAAGLPVALESTPGDLAGRLDDLAPAWETITASLATSLSAGTANDVVGARLLAKMVTTAVFRARGVRPAVAPHRDPAALAAHFPLPCIRVGGQYYADSDLTAPDTDMAGDALHVLAEAAIPLPAVDLLRDCMHLAALDPLKHDDPACGLWDRLTGEARCFYGVSGLGCPDRGLTAREAAQRADSGVHDWCHHGYAALLTATAPDAFRESWVRRWSGTAPG